MDSGSAILLMVFIQAVVFLIKLTSKRFKTLSSLLSFFQRSGLKLDDSRFSSGNTSKFKNESSSFLRFDDTEIYYNPSYSHLSANFHHNHDD